MEVSSTQIIISILVSAHFGALVVLPLGAPRHSLHTSRHVAMPAMASLTPAVFPRGRSTTWRSSIRSETRHVGGVRGGGRPAARLAITRASPRRATNPARPRALHGRQFGARMDHRCPAPAAARARRPPSSLTRCSPSRVYFHTSTEPLSLLYPLTVLFGCFKTGGIAT